MGRKRNRSRKKPAKPKHRWVCYRCQKERPKAGPAGPRLPLSARRPNRSQWGGTSSDGQHIIHGEMAYSQQEALEDERNYVPGDGWFFHNGLCVCGNCSRLPQHRKPPPHNAPEDWRFAEHPCEPCGRAAEEACPAVIAELIQIANDMMNSDKPLFTGRDVPCYYCDAAPGQKCELTCGIQSRSKVELLNAPTDGILFDLEREQLLERIKKHTGYST